VLLVILRCSHLYRLPKHLRFSRFRIFQVAIPSDRLDAKLRSGRCAAGSTNTHAGSAPAWNIEAQGLKRSEKCEN